jgi:hypothetical protein
VFMTHRLPLLHIGLVVAQYLVVSLLAQAADSDADVMERFQIPNFENSELCAFPSLARLGDGHLLCVFSVRQADPSHGRKLAIGGVESVDHGRTWSIPRVLINSPDGDNYDPSIVVIGSRVLITATTTPLHKSTISTSRTMAVSSDDDGQHWSPSYEIPMGRRYTSGKVNNGIVTREGTALLGFTWEKNLETGVQELANEGQMEEVNAVLLSYDNGRTWAASHSIELNVPASDPADKIAIHGICEPALVECGDGSIYMLSRTGSDKLYGCRSRDGGRTWSAPKATPLVSHNAPPDLCAFSGKRSGVLAVWNDSPRDRSHLSVAMSSDDCRSWSAPQVIEPRAEVESSYPSCIQAADGKIIVVYQQNQAEKGTRTIRGVRFDPAQLFADRPSSTSAEVAAESEIGGAVEKERRIAASRGPAAPLSGDAARTSMVWRWGARLPQACSAFGCTATPAGIFTVGGTYWSAPQTRDAKKQWLPNVYCFATDRKQWKQLPNFSVPISQALLVTVNGRIYAVGGRGPDRAYRETYWLETANTQSTWRRGPDLPLPLTALQGGVSGSSIYIVTDGLAMEELADAAVGPPAVLALDTANPDATWQEVAKAPEPKLGYRTMAVLPDKLLLFGGASAATDGSLTLSDSVWAFDLGKKSWRAETQLPFAMRDSSAIALDERRVLLAGGVENAAQVDGDANGPERIILSNRTMVYDLPTHKFSFVEPLRMAVADHGLVALGSEIFVIAGEDSAYRTRTDLTQTCDRKSLVDVARKSVINSWHISDNADIVINQNKP